MDTSNVLWDKLFNDVVWTLNITSDSPFFGVILKYGIEYCKSCNIGSKENIVGEIFKDCWKSFTCKCWNFGGKNFVEKLHLSSEAFLLSKINPFLHYAIRLIHGYVNKQDFAFGFTLLPHFRPFSPLPFPSSSLANPCLSAPFRLFMSLPLNPTRGLGSRERCNLLQRVAGNRILVHFEIKNDTFYAVKHTYSQIHLYALVQYWDIISIL